MLPADGSGPAGAALAAPGAARALPSARQVGLLVGLVADANVFLALAFGVLWLAHVPAGLRPGQWQPLAPLALWLAATVGLVGAAVVRRTGQGRVAPWLAALAALLVSFFAVQAFGAARSLGAPVVSLHALSLALLALHAWVGALPFAPGAPWRKSYALYLAVVWCLFSAAAALARALLPGTSS